MVAFLSGIIVLAATSILFWQCVPHGETGSRLISTNWDAWIVPLFVGGWVFGLASVISAMASALGAR